MTEFSSDLAEQGDMPNRRYEYLAMPPDATEWYIRLLTLYPGQRSDGIRIGLSEPVQIGDGSKMRYEALSYTWGSEEDPVTIELDTTERVTLSIARNLAQALTYLRYRDTPRTLWVDAICIDQNNVAERGHQVAIMGDIYERAERVVVWLGPETKDSERGLEILEEIGSQIDVDWRRYSMRPAADAQDKTLGDRNQPFPYSQEDAEAVRGILVRPWFSRLWIRQEFSLARSAVIQAGTKSIDGGLFARAVFCLFQKESRSNTLASLDAVTIFRAYTVCRAVHAYYPLSELHDLFEGTHCKDPHDRIYSIMRLLAPGTFTSIVPDYSLPASQVYQDITLLYVKTNQRLDVLASCHALGKGRLANLPTWVPDWSSPLPWNPMPRIGAGAIAVLHHTKFKEDGVLSITGVVCDTIVSVPSTDSSTRTSTVRSWQRFCTSLGLSSTHGAQYAPTGEPLLDAVCRIASMEDFAEKWQPPDFRFPSFKATRAALRQFIISDPILDSHDFDQASENVARNLYSSLLGRQLFVTADEYIGMGPSGLRQGDVVIFPLGSDVPLLIRPVGNAQYLVLGDCYMHGIMNAEPILGQLPPKVRQTWCHDETAGWKYRFQNGETGEITSEDPRIQYLRFELRRDDEYRYKGESPRYRVELEDLRQSGVNVEWFDLV
ncbi:heterokaryon incompatibility protein-domain-containing protein [Nemania sp. FL0031]|nr:heterokaryon incompatibility protein-domain-containing protein [Nemania sp. FL0031]